MSPIKKEVLTLLKSACFTATSATRGKYGFYNTDDTWLRFKDASEPFSKGGVAPVDELLRQGHVVGEHDELLDEVLAHRNLAIGR
jgi:hypothetical protein